MAVETEASGIGLLLEGLREPQRIGARLGGASLTKSTLQSLALALAGSVLFGLWTGLYAMTWPQFLASAFKAPLVLLGTTSVCFPTFYVIQYVSAPRALSLRAAIFLQASTVALIATTWVVVALPCSLFMANAENYSAAKLLVAAVAAFGGGVGMMWFVRGFRHATATETRSGGLGSLLPYCCLYALVGAQLAWSLRPFLGSPSLGFSLFRPMGGNLLESLFF